MNLIRSIGVTILTVPVYYFIAVCFGAPFLTKVFETLQLSAVLSALITLPICLSLTGKTSEAFGQLVFDFS